MILSRDHSAKVEDGRHPHERAPGELNALTEKGPQRSMHRRMLQKPLVVATLAAAIVASPLSPNKVEAAPLSLSPSATVERFDADAARFVPQSVRSLSPGDAFLFEKRYHRQHRRQGSPVGGEGLHFDQYFSSKRCVQLCTLPSAVRTRMVPFSIA